MAATACAYGYQGTRTRPPLLPDPFVEVEDDAAETVPPPAPPPPPPPPLPLPLPRPPKQAPPSLLSHHLGLCTEGLGSESSGEIDRSDLAGDVDNDDGVQPLPCKRQHCDRDDGEPARARAGRPAFPPPISVIGAGGKPWLYLRPHRADGRLVLREVRIPSQELLQARREDGRFKLQFAQPKPEAEPVDAHDHQCHGQALENVTVKEKRQE